MSRPPAAPQQRTATPQRAGNGDMPRVTATQSELFFPLPVTSNIENSVEFTNTEDSLVLFKVKTSHVNRYVVRPKVGIIHPRSTAKIRFVLVAEHAGDVTPQTNDRFSFHVRFATANDQLSTPGDCWARDKGNCLRLQLPCRFVARDQLPANVQLRMEQPGDRTPTARGNQTPMSVASPGTPAVESAVKSAASRVGEVQSQAATRLADPNANSKLTQRRSAAQNAVAGAANAGAAAVGAAVNGARNGLPPQVPAKTNGAGSPSATPAQASPTTTETGSRKTGFQQLMRPAVPTVLVLPLMFLCFLAGAYSEVWGVHVEGAMQQAQRVFSLVSTPTMAATPTSAPQ